MRILSAEAMREVDRAAIEDLGIPSLVLMENAAIGLADAVGRSWPEVDAVAIFCGPGNNGGDGLALARHLVGRGYGVEVFVVHGGKLPGGDAGCQLEICRRMGLEIGELGPESDLAPALARARGTGLVVDALFGTGLGRPLSGHFARLVAELNALPLPCLAVDLPSGFHGSGAEALGPHVVADVTVTFAAPKVAHVFAPAAEAAGELVVADLGIPPQLVAAAEGQLHLTLGGELAPYLVPRRAEGHKGDYGHAVIVAGSPGKSGAAVLAARAAVRGGAGLVTAAVPASLLDVVDAGCLESMTLACPAAEDGALAAAAGELLLAFCAGKDALAVGPGLGRSAATAAAVRQLVLGSELPLVLDADGVNAFAGQPGALAERRGPTVLTPHAGELARLLAGTPAAEEPALRARDVVADRLGHVRRAARETGAVVVLKGHRTLIATPEGEVHVNSTGNPGMATGGTGDVLTGLLAALLAQGFEALAAAQLGVYLHGLAGDLAVAELGETCLAAGDLLAHLPAAWRQLAAA